MTDEQKSRAVPKPNRMRKIVIDKLIVNCNVGESGDKLTKAAKVVQNLTGQPPIYGRGIHLFGHLNKYNLNV